ncbi:MAG TPA: type II toxin-antitoxin system Phd/YefM family antitoxin [Terriglobales bacterium]|nr:type II toxin-antitoxin system Phd/YefM family antitoxin [Terriglobales bacterium]
MEVNVHDAKTHFSRLLARVAGGEEITIARAGVPVAKLVPIEPSRARRALGMDKDDLWIAEDFDAPLREIQDLFEGKQQSRRKKPSR